MYQKINRGSAERNVARRETAVGMSFSQAFQSQVDSVAYGSGHIAVGLSSLEGNIWDGELCMVNFADGQVDQRLRVPTGVTMLRYIGSNSDLLVCARDDGATSLHKSSDITDHQSIDGAHGDCVSSISTDAFAENMFISASWDGSVKLWDLNANDLLKPVLVLPDAHFKPINDVSISRSGTTAHNQFATVGQDGFLRIWDQRMGLQKGCALLFAENEALTCVEWCSGGGAVYVGTDSGSILTYDLRQQSPASRASAIHSGPTQMDGPSSGRHSAAVKVHSGRVRRITACGDLLLTAGDDCTVASCAVGVAGSSLAVANRVKLHSDYIADLALVEAHNIDEDVDSSSNSDGRAAGRLVLTGSADKSIRLTPLEDIALPCVH